MYRVVTDDGAVDQIAALPSEALSFYAEARLVLELTPANGRPYNDDKPDGAMRELVFGSGGEGTVTYLILEDQRVVHVLVVHWFG